jgi:di/tricarboxylate transporter
MHDWHGWFTVALVVSAVLLMSLTRLTPDLIMMGAMALLLVLGILTPDQALAGFSNSGLITVAAMFIVAAGLRSTGAIDMLVNRFLGRPRSPSSATARLTIPVTLASGVLNNTPVVATLIPAVTRWSHEIGLAPSKLLMPLSYASILGGTLTLIGTSTNLVVNGNYQKLTGADGFAMFDITAIGLPLAVVGLLYVCFVLPRLLPARADAEEIFSSPRQFTVEVAVANDGPLVGKTVEDAGLRGLQRIYLVEIERRGSIVSAVPSEERLQSGDRLVFVGETDAVVDLLRINGLVASENSEPILSRQFPERLLIEAVVSPSCEGVGQSIRDSRFRDRYGAVILAVAREGEPLAGNLGSIELRAGDLLLLEARPAFLSRQRGMSDFVLVSALDDEPTNHRAARRAWLVLAAIVASATSGLLDMVTAALLGAGAMIGLRCLSLNEARRALDYSVILTIAGSFAVGAALQQTGAAEYLAGYLLRLAGDSPILLLVLTYATVMLLTELITNNAAALIVLPIVLASVASLQLRAEPYVIAVMIGASASFATPLGYQTNLMVYGPGGYRFNDFLRGGIPLNILAGVATISGILWYWPLR